MHLPTISLWFIAACSPGDDGKRPWDYLYEDRTLGDTADTEDTEDTASGGDSSGEPEDTGEGGGDTDAPSEEPFELGVSAEGRDEDVFRFVISEEQGPGFVTTAITRVQDGAVTYTVYADGQSLAYEMVELEETDVYGWFSVTPGVEYAVEVEGWFADDSFSYQLLMEHHPVPDAHEPNDRFEDATSFAGDSVQGYIHAGIERAGNFESFDDWYTFSTATGRFTVSLADVPENLYASLEIYRTEDSSDSVDWELGWSPGDDVQMEVDATGGGDWRLRIYSSAGSGDAHGLGDPPENITVPYILKVEE